MKPSAVVLAYSQMGCVGLRALLDAGWTVRRVVTHRDDPGETRWFDSVAQLARAQGVPVEEIEGPEQAGAAGVLESIEADAPDYLFSFYFRKMLPERWLKVGRRGALNLHGSMLPAYRGRCPVNWVLVNGETSTGVTLHEMDVRPDHGRVIAQQSVDIEPDDTALSLSRRLEAAARSMLAEAFRRMEDGSYPAVEQDHRRSSYFGGRRPQDGLIDWTRSARRVFDLVRAVTTPWPGASTDHQGRPLMIWWGRPIESSSDAAPGTLVAHQGGLAVATGSGLFAPLSVGWAQGPATDWSSFVRDNHLRAGSLIGPAPRGGDRLAAAFDSRSATP